MAGKFAEAISGAFSGGANFLFAPFKGAAKYLGEHEERNFKDFAEAAIGSDGKGLLDFGIKDKAGNTQHYSGAKIAGGLMGIGLGYRFLSGGGVYRDKNGNTDIAGLPFV